MAHLSLGNHCALLSDTHCLENCSLRIFCLFRWFQVGEYLVSLTPSWLEVEVTYLGFTSWFLVSFSLLFSWGIAVARLSDLVYVSASSVHPEFPSFVSRL